MEYSAIANGTYKERIPCRVEEIETSEIENALRREDLLKVERLPRVLRSSAFSPSEKGYHIEAEKAPDRKKAYVLLPAASEKGEKAALVLNYRYFTHKELLKKAGLNDEECQSSYNRVGHIIHLNLNEDTLKHKELISRVLIDKIADCKTVIRKTGNITGVFRNIEIEHLQGEKRYKTVQKENGLRFSVDYEKVYWNSKLQVERERVSKEIQPGDSVCDMFCGVGPFSILALSRGAVVYANDLNPASVLNFQESVVLNRKALGVESESAIWNDELEDRVHLYNLDAEEFLHRATQDYTRAKKQSNGTFCHLGYNDCVASQDPEEPTEEHTTGRQAKDAYKDTQMKEQQIPHENSAHDKGERAALFSHYILNLPELTLRYLEPFVYLEKRGVSRTDGKRNTVHAYFFIRDGENAVRKVEDAMQRRIEGTSRLVRKVSPSKEMWLVSFFLDSKRE